MHVLTLPEYKEQLNQKRLRAEAPWERFTSGSQVTSYQHHYGKSLRGAVRCKISMDLFVCLCICVYLYEWEGPSFFFRSYFFPSLKIKTPAQASFSIQICPREDAGGEGGEKMKHSSTSFLRGNRKRLRERDSGARSLGTMKISL